MSEETKTSTDSPITVTPKAVEKLKEHARNDNQNPDKIELRVFVQGGGCSGFQYGLMFNESTSDSDQVFESEGVKIVVDPISIRYLSGASIDFVETLEGGSLTIKNPNAKSTCGCGQSFNTDG